MSGRSDALTASRSTMLARMTAWSSVMGLPLTVFLAICARMAATRALKVSSSFSTRARAVVLASTR